VSEGFLSSDKPAPDFSDKSIEIVLRRPSAAPGTVSGEVVDARGTRVPQARISLDRQTTIADENGVFSIEIPKGGAKSPIMALKPGYLPATETLSAAVQNGSEDASESVVLHLGAPPLSIEGRVVDGEDHALAGMKVWVGDVTLFGAIDEVPATVEGLLAGAATRTDIERMLRESKTTADPEALLQDVPTVFWSFTRTDGDGKFKIEGLIDREYRVVAMDPATLLRVESEPVRAGSKDARIELPSRLYYERVAGRVVSRDGKPLDGVRVTPQCDAMTIHPTPNATTTFHSSAKSIVTDEGGRFEFKRLPRAKVYLRFDGENILPIEFGRASHDGEIGLEGASKQSVDDLVITASLRFHMQIELGRGRSDLANAFRVTDADGGKLEINVFEGSSRRTTDEGEIHDGRSPVVVVTEDAKMLVLSKDAREVMRVPLALAANGVNIVRP